MRVRERLISSDSTDNIRGAMNTPRVVNSSFLPSLAFSLALAVSTFAAESADSYFRSVASGTAEERSKAVAKLAKWIGSDDVTEREAVTRYRFNEADAEGIRTSNAERSKVLAEAVPMLIETLRTEQKKDAWNILIRITTFCPGTTDHAIWKNWWESDGKKEFGAGRK